MLEEPKSMAERLCEVGCPLDRTFSFDDLVVAHPLGRVGGSHDDQVVNVAADCASKCSELATCDAFEYFGQFDRQEPMKCHLFANGSAAGGLTENLGPSRFRLSVLCPKGRKPKQECSPRRRRSTWDPFTREEAEYPGCEDTPGFCTGRLANGSCFGCNHFREEHWCEHGSPVQGKEHFLGAGFGYPEQNCCVCGKRPEWVFSADCKWRRPVSLHDFSVKESAGHVEDVPWPIKYVESPDRCAELCSQHPSCDAFEYFSGQDRFPEARKTCYLHALGSAAGGLYEKHHARSRFSGFCFKNVTSQPETSTTTLTASTAVSSTASTAAPSSDTAVSSTATTATPSTPSVDSSSTTARQMSIASSTQASASNEILPKTTSAFSASSSSLRQESTTPSTTTAGIDLSAEATTSTPALRETPPRHEVASSAWLAWMIAAGLVLLLGGLCRRRWIGKGGWAQMPQEGDETEFRSMDGTRLGRQL